MIEQITSFRGMRILIGAAALVIIIAGVYLAQSVFIIAYIFCPRSAWNVIGTLPVFLLLIFGGSLLGFIGAILSIPPTITLKFAFENNESTRWIAVLLESEKYNKKVPQ
jgi:AI-2 transport protein TqsA